MLTAIEKKLRKEIFGLLTASGIGIRVAPSVMCGNGAPDSPPAVCLWSPQHTHVPQNRHILPLAWNQTQVCVTLQNLANTTNQTLLPESWLLNIYQQTAGRPHKQNCFSLLPIFWKSLCQIYNIFFLSVDTSRALRPLCSEGFLTLWIQFFPTCRTLYTFYFFICEFWLVVFFKESFHFICIIQLFEQNHS